MKTIQELNEKWYWRLVKFFYFLGTFLFILLFFISFHFPMTFTEKSKNETIKQIDFLYEKYNKKLSNSYCIDFKHKYKIFEYFRPLKYSNYNIFGNLNLDEKIYDIYESYKNCIIEKYYKDLENNINDKYLKEKIDEPFLLEYKLDINLMIITYIIGILLYLVVTFILQRSIYYIILGKFNPPEN